MPKTRAPKRLTPADEEAVWTWAQARHPWLTKAQVREAIFDSLEHAEMKGDAFVRWDLRCIRWIREGIKRGDIVAQSVLDTRERERKREESAQRRRYDKSTKSQLERIGPLELDGFLRGEREKHGI